MPHSCTVQCIGMVTPYSLHLPCSQEYQQSLMIMLKLMTNSITPYQNSDKIIFGILCPCLCSTRDKINTKKGSEGPRGQKGGDLLKQRWCWIKWPHIAERHRDWNLPTLAKDATSFSFI